MIEYGQALLKNNQPAVAEPVLRECLSIREKALVNRERWFRNTEETRGLLGECLTKQGADPSLTVAVRIEKLREAETLLIELANAVQEDDTSSEDDKTEAIQRVVDLYEAWQTAEPDNEDDHGPDALANKAAQWRAKPPTTPPAHR